MKRILFTALGAGLLLTSCQSDELMPGGIGSEQEVAFTVSLPDVASTRAGSVNSAKGGVSNNVGENVAFNVALYLDGHQVYAAKEIVTSTGNHTSATFKPTLVIGEEYNVVAFAEFDANEADASLKAVAVESGINNEKNDDYFVSTNLVAAPQLSAELKRPYGKLRLLADDLREAERQFNSKIKNVSVTYKETRPTKFDAVTGNFNDYVDGDQTFEAAYTEYEEGSITVNDALEKEGVGNPDDYDTIFVDYIPAAADGSDQMMPFSITVTFEDDNTYTRVFPQDIPIRRNWLTTLKGNLFTMDSELTLIIEEDFDGERFKDITYFDRNNVDSAEEFILAMKSGGEFKVTGDFTLGAGQKAVSTSRTEFTIANGAIITIADSKTGGIYNEGDLTIHQYNNNNNTGIVCENNENATRAITNAKTGKLTLDGVYLTTQWNKSGTAINNEGEVLLKDNYSSDVHIFASFYAIYNNGGTVNVVNTIGHLYHTITSTSTKNNGAFAYAIRTTGGGVSNLNNLTINAIHGAIACDNGSTVTLGNHMNVTVDDSSNGSGDSFYAVYCEGENSVANVNYGSYNSVRSAFYAAAGGVINVAKGVSANGVKYTEDKTIGK